MIFHIITIFPEAFESFSHTSIIGKAREKWLIDIFTYKLNDFAQDSSGHVDQKAYGMHGQVLAPIPLSRAIEHIFEKVWKKIPIIFFTPRGETFHQQKAEDFSQKSQEYLLICGHYEGIDQRIIDLYVDYEISLWDFVLTGGELPAQIFIDATSRLLPEVLGNSLSHEEESFSIKLDRQKEYPVYTRPQIFQWREVPDILLSGNHQEIELWKKNNLKI